MKANLIALCVLTLLASIGGFAWSARARPNLAVPSTPRYAVDGITCGSPRSAASSAGFTIIEVLPDGAGCWKAAALPRRAACVTDGRVLNVIGQTLSRDGVVILRVGATTKDAIRQVGYPDPAVERTGGESNETRLVYHDRWIELFFKRDRLQRIELGRRVELY